jgi:hypothetical protein
VDVVCLPRFLCWELGSHGGIGRELEPKEVGLSVRSLLQLRVYPHPSGERVVIKA